ncbi:hypothetical protein B7R54_10405 [Subtercola boreus]|uniref:DUF6745 domain-containing protein n=2 Tax=Subtercola boreus TaxID=120213 RepID=A0A3E0VIX6_9MICO|nr:hypothetical protein [Subtercola boreus]RFA09585.1 hypothetical protein B7R54_10405 [Subtercola boreus]
MDLAYSGYYTQFWTAWVESIEVLGVEAPGEWRGLAELGRTAHWFWAFEEFAVMVERPVLLRVDSRGLIVEKGRPTIAYGDGWSL